MSSKDVFSRILSVLAVGSALTVAGIMVRREFFPPASSQSARDTTPVRIGGWDSLIATGHRMGPENAPVTILVFADFQCPSCRVFATNPLPAIRRAYPTQVSVVFRHWPLSYHNLARPAAKAAECAARQERFEAFHDVLYGRQDSLGIISFEEFARRADVGDLKAFVACYADPADVPSISRDIDAAKVAGGAGTPTVIINGLRLGSPSDSATLAKHIDEALKKAGIPPVL